MGNFQANVLEKIKTRLLYSIAFFENLAFYKTMWKNMTKPR